MDSQSRPTVYEFGEFRVDLLTRRLMLKADGRALPVNARAFDTLHYFLEHPGELIDRSTLISAIWPRTVVEENNLSQHISALRRLLGERPEEHRFIVTVPGRGYRFVAAVHPTTPAEVPAEAPPSQPPAETIPTPPAVAGNEVAADPTTPVGAAIADPEIPGLQTAASRSGHRMAMWGIGVAGLAVIAIVWYLAQFEQRQVVSARKSPAPTSIEVVPVRTPRVAILPFENLSPDPSNAFFADGMHEEIVTTIAQQVPGIEVISRTTMMSYRASPPKPLSVVARELSASHLVEGSVRREANRIRLTLQLIDARTDGHIWSATYDRTLADTLALESQIAAEIAEQLSMRIARPPQVDNAPVSDTEAFDLYLKALLALRRYSGEPDVFRQIEDLLARVIARQPGFAAAYAQRARARTILFVSSVDTSDAFVSRIRSDLETARRLEPKNPLVLAANGFFLMSANDTSGALAAYAAAEAAGLSEAEWLIPKAGMQLRRSQIREVNATVQRMLALDPGNPLVIHFAAFDFHHVKQPFDALRAIALARDTFPWEYSIWKGFLDLDFAGRTDALRAFVDRYEPATDPGSPAFTLVDYFILMRFEHRFAELRAYIDRVRVASNNYFGGDLGPIGQVPTALFRGWTDLLLGDRTAARRDGDTVLHFVPSQAKTRWNAAYLNMLTAAGYTFQGDCEHARAASRNALALVSRADDATIWNQYALNSAQVNAWCGDRGAAISLLEELSAATPGPGPASISRDPLFTIPLGQEPAFRTLSDRLEAKIRATRFDSDSGADSAH